MLKKIVRFLLCYSFLATTINYADRPNIIFILVDDMGWSDLGCYGSEIETPNIDRLATNGIRFTRFHNTSKCFPSRACLLTGTYAQLNGNHRKFGALQNAITIGEALKLGGYRTLAVGKHHGTENLFDRGFDHYYGLRDGATNHFNPGFQRPDEPAPSLKRHRVFCFDDRIEYPYTPGSYEYYSTDTYTDWALDFIDRYKDESKPYFLYLSYQAPHDPLQAWPEDIAKYRGKYKEGYEAIAQARYAKQVEIGLIDPRKAPRSEPTHRSWSSLTEEEQDDQDLRMAVYAAMVDRVDQNLGRLLSKIEELGESENTLILFASDNGSSAEVVKIGSGPIGTVGRWASLGPDWANVGNTPFRLYKNYSYQGGICTPLVAHWPGGIKTSGEVSEFQGHFIDVMPTLLELANVDYPERYGDRKIVPLSGISFASVFKGAIPSRAQPIFWEWRHGKAILHDGWKLVAYRDRYELFNLKADWTETRNLLEAKPRIVARLKNKHAVWLEECAALSSDYGSLP